MERNMAKICNAAKKNPSTPIYLAHFFAAAHRRINLLYLCTRICVMEKKKKKKNSNAQKKKKAQEEIRHEGCRKYHRRKMTCLLRIETSAHSSQAENIQ